MRDVLLKPNTKKKKEDKMFKKYFQKWPKEIYIFWLVEFILGLELIGAVLLIFFKDWGGLSQTQTQLLQSWFTLWIFILEIPTGVIGDIKGKKFSSLLGHALSALGIVVYTITPSIGMFLLGEFLFALGLAFISGAQEAWMYEIAKEKGIKEKFREIAVTGSNLHLGGMILASLLTPLALQLFSVNEIFRLGFVTKFISIVLLLLFVKGIDKSNDNSLKPNYLGTAKEGIALIRENANLKSIALYIAILGSTSYFIIWLYQEALRVLDVSQSLFGVYRIVLLVSQIVLARLMSWYIDRKGLKRSFTLFAVITALGFLVAAILQNSIGVTILLVLAGGIGLQIPKVFSKEINDEISSDQRATVLSLVGMVKRLSLTIFNPLIGFLVDSRGVFFAFIVLGIVSMLAGFTKKIFKLKT